jgi:hypothetical protein
MRTWAATRPSHCEELGNASQRGKVLRSRPNSLFVYLSTLVFYTQLASAFMLLADKDLRKHLGLPSGHPWVKVVR